MKKFELTSESIVRCGRKLFRIKALTTFGEVQKGDLGGFVEKEENLSNDDNAWVYNNASVFGDAKVCGNAKVFNNARVCGNAKIYGNAWVCGDAEVFGSAEVYNDVQICGNAQVCGNAKVFDNAWVRNNAHVFDNAEVYGSARISGNAMICGDARVSRMSHYLVIGPIGSKSDFITFFRTKTKIGVWRGCFFYGDVEKFLKEISESHRDNPYAKVYQIAANLARTQIGYSSDEAHDIEELDKRQDEILKICERIEKESQEVQEKSRQTRENCRLVDVISVAAIILSMITLLIALLPGR